jgi:hypothetical protein
VTHKEYSNTQLQKKESMAPASKPVRKHSSKPRFLAPKQKPHRLHAFHALKARLYPLTLPPSPPGRVPPPLPADDSDSDDSREWYRVDESEEARERKRFQIMELKHELDALAIHVKWDTDDEAAREVGVLLDMVKSALTIWGV